MSKAAVLAMVWAMVGCAGQVTESSGCPWAHYGCAWEQPLDSNPAIQECMTALVSCGPSPCTATQDGDIVTLMQGPTFIAQCRPATTAP